jgi:hypothetical protein
MDEPERESEKRAGHTAFLSRETGTPEANH